jgi:hypothetical protein
LKGFIVLKPEKLQAHLNDISENRLPAEDCLKRDIFHCGLWLLGIPAILYGAVERGLAAFSHPVVATTDLSYCLIALTILLGWVFIGTVQEPVSAAVYTTQFTASLAGTLDRKQCVAQKAYRLPYPFICQIYHLLNLKHLEDIHRLSLGNLKVLQVSHFRKTRVGGQLRFKTMLDSPLNVLRMWRSPTVDVDLTIHSPHQIELKVPTYRDKCIRVLFSVIPLGSQEHQLLIQMFCDLRWPRELLRVILLLASSLTLLEDLPYLRQLAKRHPATYQKLADTNLSCETMQLYHRYVDLYRNQGGSIAGTGETAEFNLT